MQKEKIIQISDIYNMANQRKMIKTTEKMSNEENEKLPIFAHSKEKPEVGKEMEIRIAGEYEKIITSKVSKILDKVGNTITRVKTEDGKEYFVQIP